MPTGPNPYNRLHSSPRTKETATQVLAELREADNAETSVQPLPALRDALRSGNPAASAMDLPLWRPGVYSPPTDAPEPQAAEQTDIGTVAAQVVENAHTSAFRTLFNDVKDEFRLYRKDVNDIHLAEQRELHAALRDMDMWATQNGFTTAAARQLGSRMAKKELTPEDALAEIVALG